MYQYIKGTITDKGLDYCVLEANGIGYYISVSTTTLNAVRLDEQVKLYTKLIVREDAHFLCGFAEVNEREFFEHLISVSGIGQKVAMAMLSHAAYTHIMQWIISADEKSLIKLPGIGKKSAQRLIVELRDKFKKAYSADMAAIEHTTVQSSAQLDEDILLALMGLGFKREEIQRMLSGVNTANMTIEQAIKHALKHNGR